MCVLFHFNISHFAIKLSFGLVAELGKIHLATMGVASQKVMEGQACPHETLKLQKRLITQWWASQHMVLYYYNLH